MTTATRSQRILLGQIINAHGIRGEVRVRSFTADPGSVASYGPLSDADGKRQFTLKIVRVTDKGIIARVKGVDDRNAAEALQGINLYLDRALLPGAAEGEFYHADLVGLEARTPEGEVLGQIVSVQNFGAGDLLEMSLAAGGSELIPFETVWVPSIDIEGGFVVINRPDYVDAGEGAEEQDA